MPVPGAILGSILLVVPSILAATAAFADASMLVEPVEIEGAVTAVESGDGRVSQDNGRAIVFTDAPSSPFLVEGERLPGEGFRIERLGTGTRDDPRVAVEGLEPMPDGSPIRGTGGDVGHAYYAGPTDIYAHGVLGDAIEARALVVQPIDREASAQLLRLPGDQVFEDIDPRVADLDLDGRDEIVAIQSTVGAGASLAIYGLRGDGPALIARTPSIGTPNRWLNVAAIEDFDRDGILDVALVETPHIGGQLQLWSGASLVAGAPRLLAARRGYSNHAIGSRALDLAETVRAHEPGGAPRLIVPTANRRSLEMLAYEDGEWVSLASVALGGEVATNVVPVGADLMLGLGDGRLMRVTLSP